MKSVRLLIAALLLAGFSLAIWYSNKKEDEKAKEPPKETSPKILAVKEDTIRRMEIKERGGETTVLTRSDAGKWDIVEPKPLAADQGAVTSITTLLANLGSERMVDDHVTDIASYGLAPAAVEIDLTLKDGSKTSLLVGDDNATRSAVYAKVASDPRLFTMASANKTSLDKTSKDLRDKRLMTFDQDKISRVELTAKKATLEFGRINQTEWQILKPKPMRADGWQVEDLVNKVKGATMDTGLSEEDAKKLATTFATGTPVAVIKVTDAGGTQTLDVRKVKEDYYAKSSVVDAPAKVTKELATAVDKSVDDFRNKKIFDFGFSDPTHIEIRDGDRRASYDKQGDKWVSNSKTIDSTSIQALIDKLRDLSATKFVDSGFNTPQVELTVVSMDGKRKEKIEIAAAADGKFIARRDGEAALYELEGPTVSELRGTAADVKEQAPEKPGAKSTGKSK